MRIISGEYKNYRFQISKKLKIRPTTDFCKENLFNILNNILDFSKITVLDLFSGSGSISYEFLSRGSEVMSIEKNPKCTQFIKENILKLGTTKSRTKQIDAFKYIKETKLTFDLIFADPPFNFEEKKYINIIELIFNNSLLKPEGMLIIEHNKFLNFKNSIYFYENRKYGDINFSFFKVFEK